MSIIDWILYLSIQASIIVLGIGNYEYLNKPNLLVFLLSSLESIVDTIIFFRIFIASIIIGLVVVWLSIVIGTVWADIVLGIENLLVLTVLLGITIVLVSPTLTPCVIYRNR